MYVIRNFDQNFKIQSLNWKSINSNKRVSVKYLIGKRRNNNTYKEKNKITTMISENERFDDY